MSSDSPGTPLVLRLRDAPKYLGMNINRFNEEVRPFVTEVRMGSRGVAFDRRELDEWFESYKQRNGRPPQVFPQGRPGMTSLVLPRSSRDIEDEYRKAISRGSKTR